MMIMHRRTRALAVIVAVFALLAFTSFAARPAFAQAPQGLLDVNAAPESQLASLPHMTPAVAKSVLERRPFKTIIEFNKLLTDQKLTPEQAKELYRVAFVPINLNTGTRDEFLLIPGVGTRMSAEFAEYRPWKTWTQFDKEIGKYVGQKETDRLKQYFFIPAN